MRSRLGISALAGLAFGLAASAYATTTQTILVIEPVHWQADAPCDGALALDLETLPAGSVRERSLEDGGDSRVFLTKGGGRIMIEPPEIIPYDLFGPTYADVYTDLVERKPLEQNPGPGLSFTAAKIETNIAFSSMTEVKSGGRLAKPEARLIRDAFAIRLDPQISLARWVGYDAADPEEQALWDRARCESIHHELGHLFVTVQLFEESIDGALSLEGESSEELSAQLRTWFDDVVQRVEIRQELYHMEISRMGTALANSRPYLELDFPWLDTQPTQTLSD